MPDGYLIYQITTGSKEMCTCNLLCVGSDWDSGVSRLEYVFFQYSMMTATSEERVYSNFDVHI